MRRLLQQCSLLTIITCAIFALMSLRATQTIHIEHASHVSKLSQQLQQEHTVTSSPAAVTVASLVPPSPSPFVLPQQNSENPTPSPEETTIEYNETPTASTSILVRPKPSRRSNRKPTPTPPRKPNPTKSPKASARKSPSMTPTPLAVFVSESIYGTRSKKQWDKYRVDTTVNTPIEISMIDVFGDKKLDHPSFWFSEPFFGRLEFPQYDESHSNSTVTYIPLSWFTGIDNITCYGTDSHGNTFQTEILVRIQVGLVLNKYLLEPPEDYQFAESSKKLSKEMKDGLRNMMGDTVIPEHDTWLNRRYNTCAIVGNGGSLIGSKRGEEIDAHDVVVRVNSSPILKFKEDVGSKLNISFANGILSNRCWRRNESDESTISQYEIIAQAALSNHLLFQYCQDSYPEKTYTPMNYLFLDLVDSILNEYYHHLFPSANDTKYRSSGMLAVTAMATVCDHISLYGFERGPHMETFYYGEQKHREWLGHNYWAEKLYFKDLVNGTGIFEPFLELYDLYTSISFIVN